MKLPLCLIAISVSILAFQPKPLKKVASKQATEIQAIVTRLASMPFEVEAEALLMLIGAGQLSKADANEALERLFIDSSRASFKSPLVGAYPQFQSSGGDIESSKATASQALGLDQLTIQTRIISKIRESDAKRAMEMFDSIGIPSAPRSCADALMPSLDRYYQALLKLYQVLVTEKNLKLQENATFWLGSHLSVDQDAQIVPAASLISKIADNKELFEYRLARYAQDLGNLNPSYVPYFAVLDRATDMMLTLSKRASDSGISSAPLWRGFMNYNRKAVTGTRCKAMPEGEVAKHLRNLQTKLQSANLPEEAREILSTLHELKPDRVDETQPKGKKFSSDPEWLKLASDYQELRFGPVETRRQFVGKHRPDGLTSFLPLEERKSHEWDEKATKFLRNLEKMEKQTQDDPLTSFLKFGGDYGSLIAILPVSNGSFSVAVSSYLAYLASSPILKENPALWLVEVKLFLRRATLDDRDEGIKKFTR